jgi:hypothetical protein
MPAAPQHVLEATPQHRQLRVLSQQQPHKCHVYHSLAQHVVDVVVVFLAARN